MSEGKIETAKGLCVISLTRHLMDKLKLRQDQAFAELMGMELYALLMDDETRLYLETNEELIKLCDIELTDGVNSLYQAINNEILA